MTFTYQRLSGDGEVVARLAGFDGEAGAGLAGISLRASLAMGPAVTLMRTSAGQLVLHGDEKSVSRRFDAPDGAWLKLERDADTVTAFQSADGSQWTTLGAVPLEAPEDLYAGLVAASEETQPFPVTAVFSDVRLTRRSTLPKGWSAADVGGAGRVAASGYADGTFRLKAMGGTLLGPEDHFRFVYRRVMDDVELVARVTVDGAPGAMAAVLIRGGLTATAVQAGQVVTAAGRFGLVRTNEGEGVTVSSGAEHTGRSWLKLVKRGPVVSFLESADGANWTSTGTDTLLISGPFYVGLAVAADEGLATALFDRVSLRALPANLPPEVAVFLPSGATPTGTAPLDLAASASDPDDLVDAVEFYVDGVRVGVDTSTPYRIAWTGVTIGRHEVSAVAIDSDGARSASKAVTLIVSAPPPVKPSPLSEKVAPPSAAPTAVPSGLAATKTSAPASQPERSSTSAGSVGKTPVPAAVPAVPTAPMRTAMSAPVATTPQTPAAAPPVAERPWRLVFAPSQDHDRSVDRYLLEVRTQGGQLVMALDLGRPSIVNGECVVDVTRSFSSLPQGAYDVMVTAVDDAAHLSSISAIASFVR